MTQLENLNLIRFLDFYFTLMFCIGLYRRVGQYRAAGRLAVSGPGRWPNLLQLIKQHGMIFLTWTTVLPALLALALTLVQIVASRQIWPEATLKVGELVGLWMALVLLVPLGLAMFAVDVYCAFCFGEIDRGAMEKYFDQAEYWLGSHHAHVVNIFTLGYINPRRMVDVEVRKALEDASKLLQSSLWWFTVQMTLRVTFGIALWGTWLAIAP